MEPQKKYIVAGITENPEVKFKIVDETGKPLNNVSINLDSQVELTNELGEATVAINPGVYAYYLSENQNGSFTGDFKFVDGDISYQYSILFDGMIYKDAMREVTIESDTSLIDHWTFNKVQSFDESYMVKLFPNPTNEKLNIILPANCGNKPNWHLYNIKGNLMMKNGQETKSSKQDIIKINTATLENGIYFLNIQTDSFSASYKILVDH